MEFLVDIDIAAAEFEARRPAWEVDGIGIDGPTWGDDAALWPDKLFVNRAWVVRPFCWGIRLRPDVPSFTELLDAVHRRVVGPA